MAKVKQKAQTDTPQQILAYIRPSSISGWSYPSCYLYKTQKRNMLNVRQKAARAMSCPTNTYDSVIPKKYLLIVTGE
ncbi:Hypothetical protein CINCED_3A025087 [Cinara cedri]|uniref:Uncharacterized protein n=1 Tax=Cinara cedri TaxID=506608 RepID=A0A5E4NAR9_9HEMI|nr:Hypothetical protein CINCED_3A025087 [Cinara cedri]